MEGSDAATVEAGTAYEVMTPMKMQLPGGSEVAQPETVEVWRILGTVTLPKRAHTKGAVTAALAAAGEKGKVGQRFKVLGPEAAEERTLQAKAPRPPDEEFEVV